jgi:prevent-host-death family protein
MERAVVQVTDNEARIDFERLSIIARHEPVIISDHSGPAVVMLSIQEYRRLCERDQRARKLEELSDKELQEMFSAEFPEDNHFPVGAIPDGR